MHNFYQIVLLPGPYNHIWNVKISVLHIMCVFKIDLITPFCALFFSGSFVFRLRILYQKLFCQLFQQPAEKPGVAPSSPLKRRPTEAGDGPPIKRPTMPTSPVKMPSGRSHTEALTPHPTPQHMLTHTHVRAHTHTHTQTHTPSPSPTPHRMFCLLMH